MYRHLTKEEKQVVVDLVAKTGYAEVLRLLGGLINNEVPNTTENWQNGSIDWAKESQHTLLRLAHQCYNRLDNKQ